MKRIVGVAAVVAVVLIIVLGIYQGALAIRDRLATDSGLTRIAIDNLIDSCSGPVEVKLHYSRWQSYTEVTCRDAFAKAKE